MTDIVLDNELRKDLDELARACRILEMEGHGDMTLGHLSLRDPERRGFWLKRNRIGLSEVRGADDFVLVDWDGQQLAGSGGCHSEWPIHSEILRTRPDVLVVAHTHPFHACVFSASLEVLQPFGLDADYFVEVPRHIDQVALITTKEEGSALARSLGREFAVFMANHGVTFCGTSIAHTTCVGVFLEKACKAQLAGQAAGFRTSMPDPATRAKRHGQMMTPAHWEHCWHYFCRKLAARSGMGDGSPIFS
jgi:ribulose-5-phosphate 4-epimerase/fuculose-1-phosphate aldolase